MKFGSVINNILVHNPVGHIIKAYYGYGVKIYKFPTKKIIAKYFIFYLNSLENKEILFHQFLWRILKIM